MQSRCKMVPNGAGIFTSFRSMYIDEGLTGLWRGVVPTAQVSIVYYFDFTCTGCP
jgi:hypothetical protein